MTVTLPSNVECGYCRTSVKVNTASDELRSHQRTLDGGTKQQCPGSGQGVWIYPGNLRPGDEVQPVRDEHCIVVVGTPTVARDSNLWTFSGYDPSDPASKIRRHTLPGDALLRLWTRVGGDR